jgi:uncharacterized protein (DUF433 family)
LYARCGCERASEQDLLTSYPHLKCEDIRAAVAFAADDIAHGETIHSTGGA